MQAPASPAHFNHCGFHQTTLLLHPASRVELAYFHLRESPWMFTALMMMALGGLAC
jgi:hypothetical protein